MALPHTAARVIQLRRTGKGWLSYLLGAAGIAAVIDPSLDPEVYLSLAEQSNWRIVYVLETHLQILSLSLLSVDRILAQLCQSQAARSHLCLW